MRKLVDGGKPTFAFVNGVALGGGLEVALHATYRTVSVAAGMLATPEVFLGLIPGWGGNFLLPNLIGADNAVKVVVENALNQNKMLSGPEAVQARHRRRPAGLGRLPRAVAAAGRARC